MTDDLLVVANEANVVKSRVFISYSRVDGVFAEALRAALRSRGFEAYLDKEDILPGEPWEERLEALIRAADSVVFVISPDALASTRCGWEIARTQELRKRLVSLLFRQADGMAIPEELAKINFVNAEEIGRGFGLVAETFKTMRALEKQPESIYAPAAELYGVEAQRFTARFIPSPALDVVLRQVDAGLKIAEILWTREHTKWVARAAEWDKSETTRPDGKLLRAADIAAVEAWKAMRPGTGRELPQVLEDYLDASIAKERADIIKLHTTVGRAFVKPAEEALRKGDHELSLRIASAGVLLSEDLEFKLTPELWYPAVRAIRKLSSSGIQAILRTHKKRVLSASFSPDGARVVTASEDATTRIFDASRGTELSVFKGHQSPVLSATFSPDGVRVVTASEDATTRIFDASRGAELSVFKGHQSPVLSATFSPDGSKIVSSSGEIHDLVPGWSNATRHSVHVWDAQRGTQIMALNGHELAILDACFSGDGKHVLTVSMDKTIRLWDHASGNEITRWILRRHAVRTAKLSRDGTRVLITSGNAIARIFDASSGQEIATLTGHAAPIRGGSFSADSARVVTASDDGTARIWDASSGQEIATLTGHAAPLCMANFSSDGTRVVTASEDVTARIWDASTGPIQSIMQCDKPVMEHAMFSSDGSQILATCGGLVTQKLFGERSNKVCARVWNAVSGKELATLKDLGPAARAIFSPDGSRLVTLNRDATAGIWDVVSGRQITTVSRRDEFLSGGFLCLSNARFITSDGSSTARLWNVSTGNEVAVLNGHSMALRGASFSPNGMWAATWSEDATVRIWDASTGKEGAILKGHGAAVYNARFSADGTRVVTGSEDTTARIWDTSSGDELTVFREHGTTVWRVVLSPDGSRVLSASEDGAPRIWDAVSGRQIARLESHEDDVVLATFSPDGTRVVTGSKDTTARIWDAFSGREIMDLKGHRAMVMVASFSPDSSRVLTASLDRTARVWDIYRTKANCCEPAVLLAAALGRGIGMCTDVDRQDLLMQDAPKDLFAEAMRQLDDRRSKVEGVAMALLAPLHPNCYLSPTQFAEKFGVPAQSARADSDEERDGLSVAGVATVDVAPGTAAVSGEAKEKSPAAAPSVDRSPAAPPPRRRSWVWWVMLGTLLSCIAGAMTLAATG